MKQVIRSTLGALIFFLIFLTSLFFLSWWALGEMPLTQTVMTLIFWAVAVALRFAGPKLKSMRAESRRLRQSMSEQ